MTIPYTKIDTLRMDAVKRHSEALAKELAEIDSLICPKCPDSIMDRNRLTADGTVIHEFITCADCGYESFDQRSDDQ